MTREKRGQMAIFVIVAVAIVLVILLYFLFRPRLTDIIQGEFSPQSFLRSCVEDDLRTEVETLARQGGYRNPVSFASYKGEKIQYLCYTDDPYETCIVQQPMVKENFENQLNDAVAGRADECMRSLISEYEKRGYDVSAGNIETQTSLAPGKISVRFNAPLTLSRETSEKFDGFDVEMESEMYNLVFIAQSIVEYEAEFGDSATELYLQYYPNLKIEKTGLSDGTRIYKLSDVVTKEQFSFASRSVAWPAGYGFDEI